MFARARGLALFGTALGLALCASPGAAQDGVYVRLFWPPGHIGTAGRMTAPCPTQFTGPVGGLADTTRIAIAGALVANGTETTPEMVGITDDSQVDFVKFNVALTGSLESRHTVQCLSALGEQGALPLASVAGAEWYLFGAVQRIGTALRVTVRITNTETGVIERAGRGDATTASGVSSAANAAFASLGVQFGQPLESE